MNVFRALGLVEVLGSADAIQAVDVMLKTSEVEFHSRFARAAFEK